MRWIWRFATEIFEARRSLVQLWKKSDGNEATWIAPEEGWVKVNSDGASDLGPASCGGVVRGFKGEWICGFVESLGICGALEAESWGIRRGLEIAWDLGFRRVVIETDSEILARHLKGKEEDNGFISCLMRQIFDLLERIWEVKVKVVSRRRIVVQMPWLKWVLTRRVDAASGV